MRKGMMRVLSILLGVAVCFSPFLAKASAEMRTDIPSGYVIFDGTAHYLINYEELLDSYVAYADDPGSSEAGLAKFYFDTLALGFEGRFNAYVSGVTNKFVDFGAVLDKYIDTEDIGETYGWFNSDAADSAFAALTEVKTLGPDGSVAGRVFVGADGYEAVILIANPSVEAAGISNPAVPADWSNNSWGSHTASFTYLNEGHTGSRSVKVEVSGYHDGDAKWFFDPIPLEPRDYVFRDYYRSDVDTRLVLAVMTRTGGVRYIDLPAAPASESWTRYEASFTMPSDGVTATVYHLLARNGYLITDDYSISLYNYEGFDRGLVTITFDDGWEENPLTALPIMRQHGFKSNQFYATAYIEDPWGDTGLIRRFIDDGHEIGSHSITHPDLTTLTEAEVIRELEGSKRFLEDFLHISVRYFATPYGTYNTFVKDGIMARYEAHRTVDSGYNSKDNLDVSRLRCMSILSATTAAEVGEWVRKAKEEKLWLILLYHRVADDPGEYDTTPAMFAQHMQKIDDCGIAVVTMSQALRETGSR